MISVFKLVSRLSALTVLALMLALSFGVQAQAQAVATRMTPMNGSGQSTPVGSAFSQDLTVYVQDQDDAPMVGAEVVFTAPAGATDATATAIFGETSNTKTVTTDPYGYATISAADVSASQKAGQYSVSVTSGTVSTNILLINSAGSPATISVSSGAGQQDVVGAALSQPFVALVSHPGR